MSASSLLDCLELLGRPRLLVLGDLILDRYTWGDAERVSQEAPVILLRTDRRDDRLGGAANVCHMLRGLEAEVTCAGLVGDDEQGRELLELLARSGVDASSVLVDPSRPTTLKERFIGRAAGRHPHQILRVDREERHALDRKLGERMLAGLVDRLDQFAAILISDYAKGVCTPEVLRPLIAAGRSAGVPVIVDPVRGGDYAPYRGATTMTPNRLEAELATGRKIAQPADAVPAGYDLCQRLDLQCAILTLDKDGMVLVDAQGQGELFPTRVREVYDITGAGDMVLSTIGLALASGLTPADAVRLGNVAGGLEVEKVGVAQVSRAEIRAEILAREGGNRRHILAIDELAAAVQRHQAQGQRVVFTNGCFDLLHVGHVTYLEEAAQLGDVLIVGLNSDASVRRLKGPSRPVINQHDRSLMLASLASVDYVIVFDEATPHALLHRLRPDVLVKGGTYAPHEVVGHEVVEAYGGQVCVTGVVPGRSTTAILASVGVPAPGTAAPPALSIFAPDDVAPRHESLGSGQVWRESA
ncbi:MAG: D-glycero-beta-D-manno-heptose 1-phosphate adenylyltransferase [Pirellulales bacterium]|nr:D-glycero-beta-D-manno-heptose 1-phosphate adenylyltransferase [Pirellulales bacterium]